MMIDITYCDNNTVQVKPGLNSLSLHFAGFEGKYFLAGVSDLMETVETLYYDPKKNFFDCVEKIPEKIIAYFLANESVAFVKKEAFETLKRDSKEYSVLYIAVNSFEDEILCVDTTKRLPDYMKKIVWIDDDFLNDENIPFDFEKFERIDRGDKYINPKHFSVIQLVDGIRYYDRMD